jgi:hypothetical protein
MKAKQLATGMIVFDSRSSPIFSAITPSTVLRSLATKAVRCLGISRRTMREKLQRFGLHSAQENCTERGWEWRNGCFSQQADSATTYWSAKAGGRVPTPLENDDGGDGQVSSSIKEAGRRSSKNTYDESGKHDCDSAVW